MLTPHQSGPILVVAAALTRRDGRLLVQRRPDGKQHGGLWEFPGGKVEPGESPDAALARELAEELAITVATTDLTPLCFAAVPGLLLLLYRCSRWIGDPVASDGAALRWVAPAELDALPMPPADRPLIPALQEPSRS